ncbi:PDK repeat-containing protein [Frankia sp. AiPs1]|uniref:PKD domain-containing protein n=1 Tax=Frankia sp. AiPa1 TaxID=573492 RepID=UPI00202B120E|nr:PKD domain-containing protein [Frankia sp. AiPa1]MCL9759606.1 PKD domain-containing protein [Frankia sp. AiPa1]
MRRAGLVLIVAVALTSGLGRAGLLGPGVALAAPGSTTVPCATVLWGTCDTRATASGYQYRYHDGMLERIPVGGGGTGGGRRAANCGQNCPDDPAEVCELLELVGPNPEMSVAERAQYDQTMAGCNNYLIPVANAVPIAAVQAALNDYLREKVLPKPTIVIAPSGRSFANLATILYTPVSESYTFNVDEPVQATISAVPHYRWEFGDGQVGPDAPGRPYDAAISPRDHPDDYVSHQYDRAGQYQVTLTVTWQGTFTVPGVAQAFPLNAVVLAAAQPLVVDEASGVLIHND